MTLTKLTASGRSSLLLALVSGLVAGAAWAGVPVLNVSGTCPGALDVSVAGATPDNRVFLLRGAVEGTFVLPGGPCAGTQLGLVPPRLLRVLPTDANGAASFSGGAPPALCGRPLQVFDNNDCSTSNVVIVASEPVPPSIALELVAGGFQDPVAIANAGDGSGRLFIVSQRGSIRIIDNGQVLPVPFLDISTRVRFGSEQGLLGLVFHPNYANNGFFYVNYTDSAGDTKVSRFRVTANPNIANPNSERTVIAIDQPFSNHNAGDLKFGPDGLLYIATGDGGSGGDPLNAGQDLTTLLGKMLRIDVNGNPPYEIPPDNPFVDDPNARDEIWAYGLRNPWRYGFDRVTGDLFIGDVGQNAIEEIDFQPAASAGGENYGWRLMEGSNCFDPPVNCNDGTLTLPIIEYPHFDGNHFNCAVIGGFRYRGAAFASFTGVYFFSDNCSGVIWGGIESGGDWTRFELLDTSFDVSTFGEDEQGELYLAALSSGQIFRVIEAAAQ